MILIGAIVVLVGAVAAVVGFFTVSRLVPSRLLVADPGAVSALYATIGMVYAILVAIGAIAVWEPRTEAVQQSDTEATSLVEAYWAAGGLAPTDRASVRYLINSYLREVIDNEWTSLAQQRTGTAEATGLLIRLRERVDAATPGNDREQVAYDQLTSQLSAVATARRDRVAVADVGMPGPLWPILLGGALISVLFLYLFGLETTFPNGLMMATVGGMLALLLFVIYQVEYPYSRGFAVGPDSFLAAAAQLAGLG